MKTYQVEKFDNSCVIIEADSLDITESGDLLFFTAGEYVGQKHLKRAFASGRWAEIHIYPG